MNDKYYTPDISEFREGFEFQHFVDDKWKNMTFYAKGRFQFPDICGRSDLRSYPFWKNSRVKYLDKEDIESLGFKITSRDEEIMIRFTIDDTW